MHINNKIMEKKILSLATIILLSLGAFAQAPQKINYQAVARDASGNVMVSSPLTVVFIIREGSGSGTIRYSETHLDTTNQFGLFTNEIGGGVPNSPFVTIDFANINWGSNMYYLEVTVDGNIMTATQLLSVPYALHANTATSGVAGSDGLNCWDLNGNGVQDAAEDINNDGSWDALDCKGDTGIAGTAGVNGIGINWLGTLATAPGSPNVNEAYYNSTDGISYIWDGTGWQIVAQDGVGTSFTAGNGISITGNVITATLDTSVVNEIQTLSVTGGGTPEIILSNGGNSVKFIGAGNTSLSVSSNEITITSTGTDTITTSGANIVGNGSVPNPLIVIDNDTSKTNEIQTLAFNSTDSNILEITNGNGVSLASNTPTINGQVLTWDGANWTAQLPSSVGDDWGIDTVNVSGANVLGSGTVANPLIVIDNDTSATNEYQNLSWNTTDSNIIDISNGTGISLSSNTPTINGEVLTWDGANWTAQTPNNGWTKGTGNDIYNNTDSVGIGTTNPKSPLQLGDYMHLFPLNMNGGLDDYSVLTYNTYWDGATIRNTTSGTSGISILGHENGSPVYSTMLFPSHTAGTDIMPINPDLKMTLKGRGFGINADNPEAALEVGSADSASVLLDQPDDGSRATFSYRSPNNEILSLRVPNSLINGNYTLTYPTTLPATSGAPLVSDLSGNLSWGTAAAPLWTMGTGSVSPTTLTDNVGIGTATPSARLHINQTLTGNTPMAIINNGHATGDGSLRFTGGATHYTIGSDASDNMFKISNSTTGLGTSDRFVINNTGNVGIGVATPVGKLDVLGTGGIGVRVFNNSSTASTIYASNNGGGPSAIFWNGHVGIGTSPGHPLHVNKNFANNYVASIENPGTSGSGLKIMTLTDANSHALTVEIDGNNFFKVTNDLKVGVGLGGSAPSSTFHLDGTLRLVGLSGTAPAIGAVLTSMDAQGNAEWQPLPTAATPLWNGSAGTLYPATLADKIGIGTASPTTTLDILGTSNSTAVSGYWTSPETTIKIRNTDQTNNNFSSLTFSSTISNGGETEMARIAGQYVNHTLGSTEGNLVFMTRSPSSLNESMRITGDGYVGIGTSTPTSTLDVKGSTTTIINAIGSSAGGAVVDVDATNGALSGIRFSLAGTRYGGLMYNSSINALHTFMFGAGVNDGIFLKNTTYNVGIGTNNPSEKLEVVGNIEIPATNEYSYATAKSKYMSISDKDFVSGRPEMDFWDTRLNIKYSYFKNTSTTYPIAQTGIQLPDGAAIEEVIMYVIDNDGLTTYQPRFNLYAVGMASNTYFTVASATLAGNSAAVQACTDNVINHTVDNSTFQYHLKIQSDKNGSSNVQFFGFRIKYSVTKAD